MGEMTPAADAELHLLQTRVAGRYSIEREIGRGGMGIVYLARDVALDRRVAIKLLPREYVVQDTLRERFIREARIAARLSHPNIVPVYAVEEHPDAVFYAMGFVEGETLATRSSASGSSLPPRSRRSSSRSRGRSRTRTATASSTATSSPTTS
jgi:serine/threonine-protein kinase